MRRVPSSNFAAQWRLPDDAQGHHLLATVLLKLGDLPGATMELREATRLDPALIEARVTLAQALAGSGHKEEAFRSRPKCAASTRRRPTSDACSCCSTRRRNGSTKATSRRQSRNAARQSR